MAPGRREQLFGPDPPAGDIEYGDIASPVLIDRFGLRARNRILDGLETARDVEAFVEQVFAKEYLRDILAVASGVGKQGGCDAIEIFRGGVLPHRHGGKFAAASSHLLRTEGAAVLHAFDLTDLFTVAGRMRIPSLKSPS